MIHIGLYFYYNVGLSTIKEEDATEDYDVRQQASWHTGITDSQDEAEAVC